MQVVWAPTAGRDLREIYFHIRDDNPAAARSVATAIRSAANSLAEFPYKGHRGLDDTREWVVPGFPRYLLIYYVDDETGTVQIFRVWHQSRKR